MIKIYKRLIALFLICCLSPLLVAAEDPHVAVTRSTEHLLSKLKEIQPLYNTDKAAFFKALDEGISGFIDFEHFSKRVMAKYYRRATPEQRSAFIEVFRASLIVTYGEALIGFDNQNIEIVPPTIKHKNSNKTPNKSKVDLKVYGKDGAVYKVTYKLRRTEDVWKLYNLTIEAFNVGLQFRSQFKAQMEKNNQNIDAVIDNWMIDE